MSLEALLVLASMASMASFYTSVPPCEYHDEPRQVSLAIPAKLHDRLDGEWVGETRLGSVSVWFSFIVSDRRVTGSSMLDAHPSIGAVEMIGKDVRFDFPTGSVVGQWSHADDVISGTLIQAGGHRCRSDCFAIRKPRCRRITMIIMRLRSAVIKGLS